MKARPRTTTALAALAAAGLLLSGCTTPTTTTTTSGEATSPKPPVVAPGGEAGAVPELASEDGTLDVTLTAAEAQVPYDGTTRWAMAYNGQATGPTLRVHPGDRLTITLVNDLAEPTSLHTHGLHVSPEQDDPFAMVDPGRSATLTYDIPADQQAGTYWYHPHVHELTAEQVASGLSGAIIVEDATDTALAAVSTDRVLVVTDPPLVQENPWNGSGGGQAGSGMMGGDSGGMMGGSRSSGIDMMTAMVGRTGPRLLTNGRNGVALDGSGGRLERAHVVNATASTTMTLTYTGASLLALSSPGGRLPAPRDVTSIDLAPGDRSEIVMTPGAGGGQLLAQRHSNEGDAGPVGLPEVIAAVSADAGGDPSTLPTTMAADTRDLFAPDVTVARERVVTLDGHMNPTIDGQPFDPGVVNLTAAKGTVEEWVLRSSSPMAHPIHLHSWPFQIEGQPGWNDVVNVPAYGEQVIRIAFDDFAGTTVVHCHILDHEDTGMMAVIKVA